MEPLKGTEKAAFGYAGDRPAGKVVGWFRFGGAGENELLAPMGIERDWLVSFLKPK